EGVLVDRPARAADCEADCRRVAFAFHPDYFADFDPRDPHRRFGRDVDAVGERRLHFVAVAGEGDVAGEGEVGADDDDREEDRGDHRVARVPAEDAAAFLGGFDVALGQACHQWLPFGCPWVFVPWLPGTLPMTVLPFR